jgi:hypothetical protein
MKVVTIYSCASCDWHTQTGRFFTALEYNGHYKYVTGVQKETTADRCILAGLLEAIHLIREPCKLVIVTATRLSFNRVGDPKGRNKDLKRLLLELVKEKQCQLEFDEWIGRGDQLKGKLSEIEKLAAKVEPIDVVAQCRIHDSSPSTLF